MARTLADAATIGILHQRTVRRGEIVAGQLQQALTSRIVIEQAKGILAERWKIAPDETFCHLRRHARSTQRGLPDVARAVIAGTCDLTRPDPVAPA